MSLRRLLPWLFTLTMLFGQAAAFAHTLTHLRTHESALPDKVCEVCVAQAQLGTAVPPSVLTFDTPPATPVFTSDAAPLCVDPEPRPAKARAPPASRNA